MNDKRGLSGVVTIILIVLISLAAIAIVWAAISGLLSSGINSISLGSLSVDMVIKSASINSTYIAEVRVTRNVGGIAEANVTAIKFIVEDSKNSDIFTVDIPGGFPELATRTFYLDLTKSLILDLNDIQMISIAPIYVTATRNGGTIIETGPQSGGYDVGGNNTDYEPPPPFEGCTENSECGTDEWILGSDICNEDSTQILRYKKEYQCVAGGFCQEKTTHYSIQTCSSEETCYAGTCTTNTIACSPENATEVCGENKFVGFPQCYSTPPPEQIVQGYQEFSCVNGKCKETITSNIIEICKGEDICSSSAGFPECFTPLECTKNSDCILGKICVQGSCVNEEVEISGTINSIWPFTLGEYFDSLNLPKIKGSVNYVGHSIIFPGSTETRCLSIREFVYPNLTADNSYIRLNIPDTQIKSGNNFLKSL